MYYFFDPMYKAISYLAENTSSVRKQDIAVLLEDGNSPTTRRYLEKLYDSVIKKAHIDFDNIPDSKGEIVKYVGYTNLIEILTNLTNIASEHKSQELLKHVEVIRTAIDNLVRNADLYKMGFLKQNQFIMINYNVKVYNIIQSTSALLYDYIDYIKKPENTTYVVNIKNNKYRASKFYLDQLFSFNELERTTNFRNYLKSVIDNGTKNFTGMEILGLATVVSISLAIIPIMRELVYRFYMARTKISECLAQQAYYLEMNKAIIEANQDFNKNKKNSILIKQERIRNICLKLSEKIKVTHVKSMEAGKNEITKDNKLLTLDNIKKEVETTPIRTSSGDTLELL